MPWPGSRRRGPGDARAAGVVQPADRVRARRRALERQLAWGILCASAYLVLVGAGSIVAALLLLDHTRSTDLGRVAALALAGGALGATVRALYEVMVNLDHGLWELAAGLLFVAALAGMFAPNFIASLARAADAIFGKTDRPPGPG